MMKLIFGLGILSSPLFSQAPVIPENWNPQNQEFRKFYGWSEDVGSWEWVKTPEGVSVHIFTPRESPPEGIKGTLFVVHGYLEHAGTQVQNIELVVLQGWQVVALDLPGHGLSEGERAAIGDFKTYAEAFSTMITLRPWGQPWAAMGHSTGCATIMEARLEGFHQIQKVWFTAPLVRTWMWAPSMALHPVIYKVTPTLPTRYGASSRNNTYNDFLAKDPLFIPYVPQSWVVALSQWEKTTLDWPVSYWPIEVLQGTADTVVDANYNIPFLQSRFQGLTVQSLEGAYHDPFHDEPQTALKSRELFLDWLLTPDLEFQQNLSHNGSYEPQS